MSEELQLQYNKAFLVKIYRDENLSQEYVIYFQNILNYMSFTAGQKYIFYISQNNSQLLVKTHRSLVRCNIKYPDFNRTSYTNK